MAEALTLNKKSKKEAKVAWLLLAPMLLYYTIFSILPVFFVVGVSFLDWNIFLGEMKWNNFQNFITIFTDVTYLRLLTNTAIMGISILVLTMVIGLIVAIGLTKNIYLRGIQRMIWYIPVVISMAIVSDLLSKMLFPTSGGTFNILLSKFGFETIAWNQSVFWMFFWIIILVVWKSLGSTILYFIAGLNAISEDLYEAGAIEGCNKWQKFIYITLPCLKPMTSFILITSLVGIFNIFEPVQLISEGYPDGKTEVIMFRIYQEMVGNSQMGMSSAISLIVTIIVFGITIFTFKKTDLKV